MHNTDWLEIHTDYRKEEKRLEILVVGEMGGKPITLAKAIENVEIT